MENKSKTLSKPFTVLKQRSDFEKLKTKGRRVYYDSWLVLNYQENDHQSLRCGWTFPKFVGTAVVRNRFKRWTREYLRKQRQSGHLSCSVDVNVVLRRKEKGFYQNVRFEDFEKALTTASKKIRCAKSN